MMWTIAFVIIEKFNNNLEYFLNMCIANIGAFKSNFMIETTPSTIALIIAITEMGIISIVYLIYKKRAKTEIKEKIQDFQILFSYAVGSIIITYPILNKYHIILSFTMWLMAILYLIYINFGELINEKNIKKVIMISSVIILVFTLIIKTYIAIKWTQGVNKDKNSFYYGMYLKDENKESISKITDYLIRKKDENKNIKIISSVAMLYTLPLRIDNWYFDLPLTGNLGKGDYKTLTDALEKEPQGTIILIDNEKMPYSSGQLSKETIEYVKSNAKKIDEIEYFDVYEK